MSKAFDTVFLTGGNLDLDLLMLRDKKHDVYILCLLCLHEFDLAMKNGDFPHSYVGLPEDIESFQHDKLLAS